MRRHLDDGTDMRAVLRRARRLRAWARQAGPDGARRARTADVVVRIDGVAASTAFADGTRVRVLLPHALSGQEATLILLHEMAHAVLDGSPLGGDHETRVGARYHPRSFHMVLLEAALEWWPQLRERCVISAYARRGGSRVAYSMDRAIEACLREADRNSTRREA